MTKQFLIGLIILLGLSALVFVYKFQDKKELFTVMKVPEFELTDQNNQKISNQSQLGKVYLVEFFFTKCPTICPIMNNNLIEIEETINNPNFGILSISIDPENDRVQVLNQHKNTLGISNPNWHFLTGDKSYIYNLSKEFNIYVDQDPNAAQGINHSGKVALIDKNGNLRSRYNSQGFPILYYSALNYSDAQGKEPYLMGKFHPEIDYLKQDILLLLNE